MRDNQGKRIRMPRTNMNEVDVEAVEVSYELRKGVKLRFRLPPIVVGCPIAREFAHSRKWYALRRICDGLFFGPLRVGDPPSKLVDCFLWDLDFRERTDRAFVFARRVDLLCCGCLRHIDLHLVSF